MHDIFKHVQIANCNGVAIS